MSDAGSFRNSRKDGRPQWGGGLLGEQLVHYVYDGLDRLIQRRGPTAMHCEGDVDLDGDVDSSDRSYVLARLNCTTGVGNADCDAADANWNGMVTSADASYVLARNNTPGGWPTHLDRPTRRHASLLNKWHSFRGMPRAMRPHRQFPRLSRLPQALGLVRLRPSVLSTPSIAGEFRPTPMCLLA